jgi:hypothetical protein
MVQAKLDKRSRTGAEMTTALELNAVDDAVLDIIGRRNPELSAAVEENYGQMLPPVREIF